MRLISVNVANTGSTGKHAVAGPVEVSSLGLMGDASPRREPSRALYAYPSEHFLFWKTVRAQARVAPWREPLAPGGLGEQLTLAGLLETDVWVGDVLRFADCTLAVSEPRLPDAALGATLGFAQAVGLMAANAWCGFFLAVREPGSLQADEPFQLVPGPREVGISELFRARVPAGRR